MITHLSIRNLAIIDHLSIDLNAGMIALTGETGAGKSILLDALGLVLGQRANSTLIRNGSKQAEVTASFDITQLEDASQWLSEQALTDEENNCILRRVINLNGATKAWINGTPVNLSTLSELGQFLTHIHSQHAHQNLLKLDTQRHILDQFGQHDLNPIQQAHQAYKSCMKKRQDLSKLDNIDHQLELLNYQLSELNQLSPEPEEWESLEQKHKQNHQSEALLAASQKTEQYLGSDQGALTLLNQSLSNLQNHQAIFPQLDNLCELLNDALTNCEEAYKETQGIADTIEVDVAELQRLEQRISDWHALARKHHCDPSELVHEYQQLQQRQQDISSASSSIEQVDKQLAALQADWQKIAQQLTLSRANSADQLSHIINNHLAQLGLRRAISIQIESGHQPVNAYGQDQITFLFQPNLGQAPKPLHKIASGGELSRIGLAIAVSIAETIQHPCLIFDEVDVGVGGATAEIVGKMLHTISQQSQTIVITHQAQVAAQADCHLHIHKTEDNQQTYTAIKALDSEQRAKEIARMIGGVTLTERTLARAKEMLDHSTIS